MIREALEPFTLNILIHSNKILTTRRESWKKKKKIDSSEKYEHFARICR
jgi:hypothetical protein